MPAIVAGKNDPRREAGAAERQIFELIEKFAVPVLLPSCAVSKLRFGLVKLARLAGLAAELPVLGDVLVVVIMHTDDVPLQKGVLIDQLTLEQYFL